MFARARTLAITPALVRHQITPCTGIDTMFVPAAVQCMANDRVHPATEQESGIAIDEALTGMVSLANEMRDPPNKSIVEFKYDTEKSLVYIYKQNHI